MDKSKTSLIRCINMCSVLNPEGLFYQNLQFYLRLIQLQQKPFNVSEPQSHSYDFVFKITQQYEPLL
jgi:hypothetical protein